MNARLLVLVIAFAAAGCISEPQSDSNPDVGQDDSGAFDDAVVSFLDCPHHEAFWKVPYDEVAHLVPAPFTARDYGPGIPQAGFYVTAFRCPTVNGTVMADDVTVLWAGIAVDVPEDLEPGREFNGYLLGSYHTSEETAAVFEAWGQGEIEVAPVQFEDVGHGEQGYGLSAAGSVTMRTFALDEAEPLDELHARFWTVQDGTVHGAMDLRAIGHNVIGGGGDISIDGSLWGASQLTPLSPIGFHGDIEELRFSWHSEAPSEGP